MADNGRNMYENYHVILNDLIQLMRSCWNKHRNVVLPHGKRTISKKSTDIRPTIMYLILNSIALYFPKVKIIAHATVCIVHIKTSKIQE